MLRKILLVGAVVALSVPLSNCSTVPTDSALAAQIAEIRATATKVCGFVPTFASASGILTTFIPSIGAGASVAFQVAQAICDTVTKSGVRRGAAADEPLGYVQGKPVYGSFKLAAARHR